MVKKYHSALALRLGRNIAAFRRSAALKQEQLAELIDVEISTVSRYETGATLPSLVTLAKLAEVLHCTMAELLAEKIPADSPEAIRIEAVMELLLPAERKMLIDVIETLVEFSRQQKAMILRKH